MEKQYYGCTREEWFFVCTTFEKYKKKFEKNLLVAWFWNMVDWKGLAMAAEKAIESGVPPTHEQISSFHPKIEDGYVY